MSSNTPFHSQSSLIHRSTNATSSELKRSLQGSQSEREAELITSLSAAQFSVDTSKSNCPSTQCIWTHPVRKFGYYISTTSRSNNVGRLGPTEIRHMPTLARYFPLCWLWGSHSYIATYLRAGRWSVSKMSQCTVTEAG